MADDSCGRPSGSDTYAKAHSDARTYGCTPTDKHAEAYSDSASYLYTEACTYAGRNRAQETSLSQNRSGRRTHSSVK
jgi:hypothetical protein